MHSDYTCVIVKNKTTHFPLPLYHLTSLLYLIISLSLSLIFCSLVKMLCEKKNYLRKLIAVSLKKITIHRLSIKNSNKMNHVRLAQYFKHFLNILSFLFNTIIFQNV